MSSDAKYKILYDEYETSYYIRLPFAKFSWLTVCLPLFAFLFAVVYSVLFNFDSATFTHCNVYNFLPSISAAIGNFSPQKEVWQTAIALHALPRFCMAASYFQYNREILTSKVNLFIFLACLLNVIENVALIILSFWTSSENYPVHKRAFVTFIVISELYMLLLLLLHRKCRKITKQMTHTEMKSLRWKTRLVGVNIVCILAATYFFMRHNSMCEPFVYTAFAFFEYIVVLSNMAFHMTAYYDFRYKDLVITKYGILVTNR